MTAYRFIRPLLPPPDRWIPYLEPAYAERRYSNFGPVNHRFEAAMEARFGGGRAAVTVSNATVGLSVALTALGVTGHVLVPSFTFAATALAVQAAGCVPVLCDCDPDTLTLSAKSAAEAARRLDRVGAILPVRPFGMVGELAELEALAQAHDSHLVVDAAAALGAPDGDNRTSRLTEVFSLHATKTFPIGEGGLIFAVPDRKSALCSAQNFGFNGQDTVRAGTNGKMSEFQAAIGLAVLEDFDQVIRCRQTVAGRYEAALAGSPRVERVWRTPSSPWSTYPVLLREGLDADQVIDEAARRGVELRRYYRPLHGMPHFRDSPRAASLSVTERIAPRMVCLPVYSDMTAAEQDDILDRLAGLVG